MGKILTEAELRSGTVKREGNKVFVAPDTFITELAKEYITNIYSKINIYQKDILFNNFTREFRKRYLSAKLIST